MEVKSDLLESAREKIEKLLEHLVSGRELTKQECNSVISDLELLACPRQKEKKGEIQMDTDMETMLQAFSVQAENSRHLLQEMLDVISQERVPGEKTVVTLDNSIALLRKQYAAVYQMARQQLPDGEMPADDSPASAYAKAVSNSQTLKYQKLLKEIRSTLESFVAVRSLTEAYTEALKTYQEKAMDLIRSLNQPDRLEDAAEGVKGPELFLKVLSMENNPDADVDNLEQLEDQLDNYYSKRVRRGVVKKEYYVDDSLLPLQLPEESAPTPQIQSIQVSEESDVAETTQKMDEQPEAPVEEGKVPEISEFARQVQSSGLLITEKEFDSVSLENNDAESKKVSATIFLNEMRKGMISAEKMVIQSLMDCTAVTSDMMIQKLGMQRNFMDSTLDYMYRKGYLRKCELMDIGSFFIASPRLEKALSQQDSRKFAGVHSNIFKGWDERVESNASCALACFMFSKLHADSMFFLKKRKLEDSFRDSLIQPESFLLRNFPKKNPDSSDVVIGAFWTDTAECDEFIKQIRNKLSEVKECYRVVYAGLNLEKARILADLLEDEKLIDSSNGNRYLYSAREKCYYEYPSMNPVDFSEGQEHSAVTEQSAKDEPLATVEQPVKEAPRAAEQPVEGEYSAVIKEAGKRAATEDVVHTSETQPDEMAKTGIVKKTPTGPDPDTRQKVIFGFLADKRFYAATAYAKAASLADQCFEKSYRQLAYALNDPLGHCVYSSDNAFNLFAEDTPVGNAMNVATAIRTFFSNRIRYDYNIKSLYDNVKNSPVLEQYPELSKIVYALMEFKDTYQKGVAAYAGRSRTQEVLERELQQIRHEASDFYDNFVTGRKREKASQKRFIQTKQLIFSSHSEIGEFVKSIVDGDMEILPLLGEFLQMNFFTEDSIISEESIDGDMLWSYIVEFWEKAGDMMMYRRNMNLISSLRTNITNLTTKAVQLLARWYVLGDQKISRTEDEGAIAYKKLSIQLLENIDRAVQELETADKSTEQIAGTNILLNVLEFVRSAIDGTLDENRQKFYYAPFLLTDDVMLDDNCMPEFDVFGADVAALSPCSRIVAHTEKCVEMDYENRLEEMLNGQDVDNCGMAISLVGYLHSQHPNWEFQDVLDTINRNEDFARERAEFSRDDFIGELELAQSYGQIDNSKEDVKEKILQIVDNWYEWAENSTNYGFFCKVLNAYLSEIRENARSREAPLLEQLRNFRESTVAGLSIEAKNKRIDRIEAVIKSQNYTVAEDLLARASNLDDDAEEIIDEDFLQDFLDNYDDYYRPVSSNRTNLASLVSNRVRNKQGRGAQRLVDNWLPGGGMLGPDRLRNLLTTMGFRIDRITAQNPIGKFENFVVHTASATDGMRNNYTHPIAALGSDAIQNGFRVVCINGTYDADSLIDVMKQIGNARHTIILLDCALPLAERRHLARKTKSDLADKLFAVIDRTVLMFLIRNYDETRINRMMVALVTPFGFYQPYVWESSNVMPPEIFIGRKHELERIKAPRGTNIVYGGRQLGKSALLKKAQEDIDRNEKNDRAVYLEIKGLDYQRAAQKIAHELYDQGVLEADLDTQDWAVLARAIKRRLQQEENRISYLLLLLDEADAFIESSGMVNYQPFDALKEIQTVGHDRFKFVVAGLRNVVRFKREVALNNNSVLTHLESMTVKPFKPSEARELMEVPLHYLGLRFPKEKESLVTLILATTNYFPGLIQMYCAKLLEAMRNKNYAGYAEANTPIYEVSEDHIKKVLSDPEFNQQIREKFVITLKLDEDNYYYLIALIMAYLYHTNGYNEGYTAEDIHKAGSDLAIGNISRLDLSKLSAFMEELRELNVLRSSNGSQYLFTRFTFFQMMGTSTEVEDHLMEYMED